LLLHSCQTVAQKRNQGVQHDYHDNQNHGEESHEAEEGHLGVLEVADVVVAQYAHQNGAEETPAESAPAFHLTVVFVVKSVAFLE